MKVKKTPPTPACISLLLLSSCGVYGGQPQRLYDSSGPWGSHNSRLSFTPWHLHETSAASNTFSSHASFCTFLLQIQFKKWKWLACNSCDSPRRLETLGRSVLLVWLKEAFTNNFLLSSMHGWSVNHCHFTIDSTIVTALVQPQTTVSPLSGKNLNQIFPKSSQFSRAVMGWSS